METIENNKLIAGFMGSKYINEPFKDSKGEMQDFWHWSKPENGYPRDMNIDTAPEMSTAYMIENFSYHKSWDWLMPVVETIESTVWNGNENLYSWTSNPFQIRIQGNDVRIVLDGAGDNSKVADKKHYSFYEVDWRKAKSKIELVYLTCVAFIKWYNQNK